jgi:hypothetical protein
MGLAAGYACGLVLTGVAALVTIAALGVTLLVHKRRAGPTFASAGIAIVVYLLTNPFVAINALTNRDALTSNISNSTAMYAVNRFGEGMLRVSALLIESIGGPTLAMGIVGSIVLIVRYSRPALLASAAGLALMLLCAAIGAGKPPEFARFLVLPDTLLCAAGGVALVEVGRRSRLIALLLLLACLITADGRDYVNSFRLDAGGTADSRSAAAAWLREHLGIGESIGVLQEPAPYSVPPLDFATRRVILLPATPPASIDRTALPEWLVFTDDCALNLGPWDAWTEHYEIRWTDALRRMKHPSPISWANKPVFVYRRIDLNAPTLP